MGTAKTPREMCATQGCARQAHKGIYCRPCSRDVTVFPQRQIVKPLDYRAFEDLIATSRDLLWEMDRRSRRQMRRLPVNHRIVEKTRIALRLAEDTIRPTPQEDKYDRLRKDRPD